MAADPFAKGSGSLGDELFKTMEGSFETLRVWAGFGPAPRHPSAASAGDNLVLARLATVDVWSYLESRGARDVFVLRENSHIEDAFNAFHSGNLHAAPVANEGGEIIGMVDMGTLIRFMLAHSGPRPQSDFDIYRKEIQNWVFTSRSMSSVKLELVLADQWLTLRPWSDYPLILGFEEKDPSRMIPTPLTDIVRVMILGHRNNVPVLAKNKLCGIITMWDLVKYIEDEISSDRTNYFQGLGDVTLQDLPMGTAPVISISDDSTAMQCLELMKDQSISAVAVVTKQGRLTGVFSESNVRGLYQKKMPSLSQEVTDFLDPSHAGSMKVLAVTNETTLSQLLRLVLQGNVHRVFMVDGDWKPVKCISLIDIVETLTTLQFPLTTK
jgi:CBS domain-containing protein